MKLFLSATMMFFFMNVFAEDPKSFLEKTIHSNRDKIFYNGIDYMKLGEFINTPSVLIESKGHNSAALLTNSVGQFVKFYSLLNTDFAFESYTLTFTFFSANGVENSFNCLAVDQFNCGKIELRNCTKSHLGYSFRDREQVFTYDPEKSLRCAENDSKNNNEGRLLAKKNVTEGKSSSRSPAKAQNSQK